MIEENLFVPFPARCAPHSRGRTALGKIRRGFSFCLLFVFACSALCGFYLFALEPARVVVENSRRYVEMSNTGFLTMSGESNARGAGGPYIETSEAQYMLVAEGQANHILENLAAYAEVMERERSRMPSIWPTVGNVTDRFGFRRNPFGADAAELHTGQDISAPSGTPVVAAGSGQVEFAGTQNGYGNIVIIAHGDGLTTRYAHLSAINVSVGETITRGVMIGRVGSTGRSSGPHLHYEVRVGENPVDPRRYLPDTAN